MLIMYPIHITINAKLYISRLIENDLLIIAN